MSSSPDDSLVIFHQDIDCGMAKMLLLRDHLHIGLLAAYRSQEENQMEINQQNPFQDAYENTEDSGRLAMRALS